MVIVDFAGAAVLALVFDVVFVVWANAGVATRASAVIDAINAFIFSLLIPVSNGGGAIPTTGAITMRWRYCYMLLMRAPGVLHATASRFH